jgi:hypothetical protein
VACVLAAWVGYVLGTLLGAAPAQE